MLLEALRERTRDHHLRLERDLAIEQKIQDLPTYCDLLQRWYGWYSPFEQMAASEANDTLKGFLSQRWKTPLLEKDIWDLCEAELGEIPLAPVAKPRGMAEWIGTLYVLEGSTLGGQVISRMIEERLGLRNGQGYSFFRSYGDQVGARWREFRTFAQQSILPENTDRAVAAADQTFQSLHQWLCTNPR